MLSIIKNMSKLFNGIWVFNMEDLSPYREYVEKTLAKIHGYSKIPYQLIQARQVGKSSTDRLFQWIHERRLNSSSIIDSVSIHRGNVCVYPDRDNWNVLTKYPTQKFILPSLEMTAILTVYPELLNTHGLYFDYYGSLG